MTAAIHLPHTAAIVAFVVICCILTAGFFVHHETPRATLVDDDEQPIDAADVIDLWSLPILAESPLFLQTIAEMPVAGELAAKFAADVEAMLAGGQG